MAVKAYIGANKSGKSFEVVSNYILGALRQGRRVVSNIAGLNYQVMVDYLVADGVPREKIGTLVSVTHKQILEPNFFRTDEMTEPDDSFIQPGDACAFDEIWRFWPKRKAIPDNQMNFFRMHAHFIHPDSGLACEIAIITQLMRDIHPDIKGLLVETYWMVKKIELGKPNMYTVHVYERDVVPRDPSKDPGINSFVKTYDPRIFPMYKSHSMGGEGQSGKEQNIDGRGSMFAGKLFKYGIPLALLGLGFGIWKGYQFFHTGAEAGKMPGAQTAPGNTTAADAASMGKTPAAAGITAAKTSQDVQTTWRVAGWYGSDLDPRIVLVDATGRSRTVIPKTVARYGSDIKVTLHNEDGSYSSWSFPSSGGLFTK